MKFEYYVSVPIHITKDVAKDIYGINIQDDNVEISANSKDEVAEFLNKFGNLQWSVGRLVKNTLQSILDNKLSGIVNDPVLIDIVMRNKDGFTLIAEFAVDIEYYFDEVIDVDANHVGANLTELLIKGIPDYWTLG